MAMSAMPMPLMKGDRLGEVIGWAVAVIEVVGLLSWGACAACRRHQERIGRPTFGWTRSPVLEGTAQVLCLGVNCVGKAHVLTALIVAGTSTNAAVLAQMLVAHWLAMLTAAAALDGGAAWFYEQGPPNNQP